MFLGELTRGVQTLRGVGPRMAEGLEKLGIYSVKDLLTHFPRDYTDRSCPGSIRQALGAEKISFTARVIAQDYFGYGRKKTLKIYIEDDTGRATLICFNRSFLANILVPGKSFLFTGSFKYRFNEIQSTAFEYEPLEEGMEVDKILPLYPLTAGVSQNILRKALKAAFLSIEGVLDCDLPRELVPRDMSKEKALKAMHFPSSLEEVKKARDFLAFEELFYLQLFMTRRGLQNRGVRPPRKPFTGELVKGLLTRLPFSLTPDQITTCGEIKKDLLGPAPMQRLLQGDVGSGKTLVALLSALLVVEGGEQTAFLAPTELLARQHAEKIADLTASLGVHTAFLSGNLRSEARENLLAALARGEIHILVGTHALFSSDVTYKNLGLVIIDEQHKFGVLQRAKILDKGLHPDLLLMTATPIPRTLALTAFGDLETSEIKTMPPGRKPVKTHLAREDNAWKVYDRVKHELALGQQAYFVYPLIEESEKIPIKDAEGMFTYLGEKVFPGYKLGLIHSRLPEEEKRETMDKFYHREFHILVATSVVEVGVDVPNATIMVIEHAERFGLSALHQLRGRVGRSDLQSYAFLIYNPNLTEEGIQRLKVMKETTDGFRLAEEDLKIRGPGELLGIRQSGFLRLKAADLVGDQELLLKARKEAFRRLKEDPGLLNPENQVIREVLTKAPPYEESFLNGG